MRCEPKTDFDVSCASSSGDDARRVLAAQHRELHADAHVLAGVFAGEREREEPLEVVLLGAIDERRDDRGRERRVERAEDDAGDEARVDVDVLRDARPRMHDAHASRMLLEARDQVPDP